MAGVTGCLRIAFALCWPLSLAVADEVPPAPASVSVHGNTAGATVISGTDIERNGYRTLHEAARRVPGLAVSDLGPRGGDTLGGPAMRTVRGLDTGIPAYWGEIPVGFDPRLLDMDRVEVLTGPQGVSHGLGAMAGVVRYLPRKPDTVTRTFELSGDGFMRAHGREPGGDFGLTANLPLKEGRLAVRASLGVSRDPGVIDYSHLLQTPGVSHSQPASGTATAHLRRNADADTGRTLSARLLLLWNATEDVEVMLSHQTHDLFAGAYRANHARAYGTGLYESARRYTEPLDRTDQLWSLDIGWDMGSAKLDSTLGYTRWSAVGRRDQTDFLLAHFGIDGLLPDSPAGPDLAARPCDSADPSPFCAFSAFTRDTRDVSGVHGTLRLSSTGDDPWGWSVGASQHSWRYEGYSREFSPGLSRLAGIDPEVPMDLEYDSESKGEETQQGLFGTLSRRLGKRLRMVAGARWFRYDDTSGTATRFPFTPKFNVPYKAIDSGRAGTLLTVGAEYRLAADRFLYAVRSEGEGANAEGFNNFPVCTAEQIAAGETGQQPSCVYGHQIRIEPDSMVNHEIGLRGSWFDGRVTATGTLFQTDWVGARMPGRTPFSKQTMTQNTDVRSRGADIAMTLRPTDALQLHGFWSYARAELIKNAPGLLPDGTDAFKGDRVAGAPEHRAGLIVSQRTRLSDNLLLDLSYDYAWTGSVLSRIGGRGGGERFPGYGVHGLSASLSGKSTAWVATLYAENLLNESTAIWALGTPMDIRSADGFGLRRYTSYVLPPRRVGLRLRYMF